MDYEFAGHVTWGLGHYTAVAASEDKSKLRRYNDSVVRWIPKASMALLEISPVLVMYRRNDGSSSSSQDAEEVMSGSELTEVEEASRRHTAQPAVTTHRSPTTIPGPDSRTTNPGPDSRTANPDRGSSRPIVITDSPTESSFDEDEEVLSSGLEDFEEASIAPASPQPTSNRRSPTSLANPGSSRPIASPADRTGQTRVISHPALVIPNVTAATMKPTLAVDIFNDCDRLNLPVCSRVPARPSDSVAYLVDTTRIFDLLDLHRDGHSTWVNNGTKRDGVEMVVAQNWSLLRPRRKGPNNLVVTRYFLKDYPSVKKVIYYICREHCRPFKERALIVYSFTGGPRLLKPVPHGNDRKGKPFVPKKKSTRDQLEKRLVGNTSSRAVAAANRDVGGVTNAESGADLADVSMAEYLLRKSRKATTPVTMNRSKEDDVVDLLQVKMSVLKDYIWTVSVDNNLSVVIGHSQLTKELIRSGADHDRHYPVVFDPSYNFGPFYATSVSFKNLVLKTKSGANPAFVAAIFLHCTREAEDYKVLFNELSTRFPNFCAIRAYGTDGEPALESAFESVVTGATHLRCFRHFARNVKDYIRQNARSLKRSEGSIVVAIFGFDPSPDANAVFVSPSGEAIVEARDEADFDDRFDVLISDLQKTADPDSRKVVSYLNARRQLIKTTMSSFARRESGLGENPPAFTTNIAEATNSKMRCWQQSRRAPSFTDFCYSMRELLDSQYGELCEAYGAGATAKHSISAEYQLAIAKRRGPNYLNLTAEGRKRFFQWVTSQPMSQLRTDPVVNVSKVQSLSIPLPEFEVQVPAVVLRHMYFEAAEIVRAKEIMSAPSTDHRQRFSVRGRSSPSTSMGKRENEEVALNLNTNELSCSCKRFAVNRMCTHSLAVAEHKGMLPQDLLWHRNNMRTVSIQRFVDSNSEEVRRGRKSPLSPRRVQKKKKRRRPETTYYILLIYCYWTILVFV